MLVIIVILYEGCLQLYVPDIITYSQRSILGFGRNVQV